MSRPRALGAALSLAAAALVLAGTAQAKTIAVHPGGSIQAAVDAAKPGDKIVVDAGTYQGNVTITKNNIDLRGAGIGKTMLTPAAPPTQPGCPHGICVIGQVLPTGDPGTPVKGTDIEGFTIGGFQGFGVFLFNADNSDVTDTEAANNGGYGISGFVLHGVEFRDDVAHGNGEPGFYIGDSPHADAKVIGNTSYGNGAGGEEGDGFLFRDSSHGQVKDNFAFDNCLGFNVVDSPENPDPAEHWELKGNVSLGNNRPCHGETGGGAPPLSGIGFAVLGAHHVKLQDNIAIGNAPGGFSAIPSGGIVVVSNARIGGSDPDHLNVEHNTAHENVPVDVFWDGSGSHIKFEHNDCGTSSPPGLCS